MIEYGINNIVYEYVPTETPVADHIQSISPCLCSLFFFKFVFLNPFSL